MGDLSSELPERARRMFVCQVRERRDAGVTKGHVRNLLVPPRGFREGIATFSRGNFETRLGHRRGGCGTRTDVDTSKGARQRSFQTRHWGVRCRNGIYRFTRGYCANGIRAQSAPRQQLPLSVANLHWKCWSRSKKETFGGFARSACASARLPLPDEVTNPATDDDNKDEPWVASSVD
jgi:hypothetical protein